MLAQRGKAGDDDGKTKYDKQNPWRNFDHITSNNFEEKGHYAGNIKLYTHTKIKEDAE